MADEWNMSVYITGMLVTEKKQSTKKRTCTIAYLPAANFTWTDLGSISGRQSDTPATSRLSHGTATLNTENSSTFYNIKSVYVST